MVFLALTCFLEKCTRQVSSVPWSSGLGVRVSMETWEAIGLVSWEEGAAPIQEKVGAGHRSESESNTQMAVTWCPGSRTSGT